MTLLELRPGTSGRVVGCVAGHGIKCRLAAMGFTPGSLVTVLNNHRGHPVLVMVHGARVALGRGQAAGIAVRPEETDDGDGSDAHA
jgi:ferrous iron transport protein A